MAGRLGNKFKGLVTIWYGVLLIIGVVSAIVLCLYWIYNVLANQESVDWGVIVLLIFLITIVAMAVFFLPRFRARREERLNK